MACVHRGQVVHRLKLAPDSGLEDVEYCYAVGMLTECISIAQSKPTLNHADFSTSIVVNGQGLFSESVVTTALENLT